MTTLRVPDDFGTELKQIFLSHGFTEEQFKSQMRILGQLILMSALAKLFSKNPPKKKFSSEKEVLDFLSSHFSEKEIHQTIEEESKTIVAQYIKETLGR